MGSRERKERKTEEGRKKGGRERERKKTKEREDQREKQRSGREGGKQKVYNLAHSALSPTLSRSLAACPGRYSVWREFGSRSQRWPSLLKEPTNAHKLWLQKRLDDPPPKITPCSPWLRPKIPWFLLHVFGQDCDVCWHLLDERTHPACVWTLLKSVGVVPG